MEQERQAKLMAMQESNQINHDQTPEPASNLRVTLLRVALPGKTSRNALQGESLAMVS